MKPRIQSIFTQISDALSARKHPWQWPVMSTVSPEGQPHSRIVVLREFHEETAFVFTDSRSQKIIDLRDNPSCSLLFFNPDSMLQVRAGSSAIMHHGDSVCVGNWASLNARQRREYQVIAASGKPHSSDESEVDSSLGMAHFAVLELSLNRLDILQVTREAHIRHLFVKDSQEWTGGQIIG